MPTNCPTSGGLALSDPFPLHTAHFTHTFRAAILGGESSPFSATSDCDMAASATAKNMDTMNKALIIISKPRH